MMPVITIVMIKRGATPAMAGLQRNISKGCILTVGIEEIPCVYQMGDRHNPSTNHRLGHIRDSDVGFQALNRSSCPPDRRYHSVDVDVGFCTAAGDGFHRCIALLPCHSVQPSQCIVVGFLVFWETFRLS